jgi:hypothetical protein
MPRQRGPEGKFEIPDGWAARGFEFEVEWPADPAAAARIRSHFGARRKAYNWALGQVKADMDARKPGPGHTPVQWNLYALRKRWNAEKGTVGAVVGGELEGVLRDRRRRPVHSAQELV